MSKQSKNIQGKENYLRMHYLNEASELMAKTALKSNNPEFKQCADFVATYYSNLLINVAKKTVLRLDCDIKRNICKRCHCRLMPGENSRVRIRRKPEKHLRKTCLKCGSSRIYNTRKGYSVWSERPEAISQIIEIDESDTVNNQSQSQAHSSKSDTGVHTESESVKP